MEDTMPETNVELEEKREHDIINDKREEKKSGVITHFMSNLVSPLSPRAGVLASQNDENCCDGDLVRSGCGVMNNLISNLSHHSDDHKRQTVEESSEIKKDEESGKRGIIDNIVSHFPTSIPDDAVPTTDEALILINSIVKD